MSKLYTKYLKCKCEDKDKYYLFKSGMFYIFIDEDARKIAKFVPLKLINLNKDVVKCGFPCNQIDKYMDIFRNIGLCVEIVQDSDESINDSIIKEIKLLDIDNINPLKALEILYMFSNLEDSVC